MIYIYRRKANKRSLPSQGLMMARINNFFTNEAHLTDEAIGLYVDALRFDKVYHLPSVILSHVVDCRECKMEIIEIFSLLQNSDFGSTEAHPFLNGKTAVGEKEFSIAFRVAAVIIIGISVGLVAYYFRMLLEEHTLYRGSIGTTEYVERGTQDIVPSDSLVVKNQELFADNFAVSPNLENLVNAHSRSLSIQVLSPLNGENFRKRVLFQWKADADGWLTLKVLSNKERTLHTISVRGSRYVFSQKFPAGLYYWKLENKDELLYLGKFLVKY